MGKLITQITIAVLGLYVMVQALFWPIILKPGTQLEWWQNPYAAKIGQYVGFPVWAVLLNSPFSGTAQLLIAWALVIAFTVLMFWLSGTVIKLICKY
jgi:hypothetical protein